jgi:hypothetical protein
MEKSVIETLQLCLDDLDKENAKIEDESYSSYFRNKVLPPYKPLKASELVLSSVSFRKLFASCFVNPEYSIHEDDAKLLEQIYKIGR